MCSCLVHPCKPFPLVRIAFIAVLTLLLSGWSTCNAIVNFSSCPGTVPQPLINSLSPDCASSLFKTHWKRCGLNRGQRSTGGWLRYVRHLGCACVSTVDRMSQTAAVEDEETVISNTDLGSSVVAVMQSAQASPRDHPSAPD
jgi:hypothetical protein